MSKIGTDQLPKILSGYEQLVEDIKKRNQATITGVKIPELIETKDINPLDEIIVEQDDGTKRVLLESLLKAIGTPKELEEARPSLDGTQNGQLKERLDKMETVITSNKQDLDEYKPKVDALEQEVHEARGVDEHGVPFPTLSDRLDDMDLLIDRAINGDGNIKQDIEDLRQIIERNSQNINLNKESINDLDSILEVLSEKIDEYREKVDKNTTDIAGLRTSVSNVESRVEVNEKDIQELKTKVFRYREVVNP